MPATVGTYTVRQSAPPAGTGRGDKPTRRAARQTLQPMAAHRLFSVYHTGYSGTVSVSVASV